MSYDKKVQIITASLEEKIKDISPGDFRFYNIAHLPLVAKKTAENADSCEECLNNLAEIEKLTQSLPNILTDSKQSRKLFENEKEKIERHLKKSHRLHFPGFFTALGSLLGVGFGIIAAILISFFTNLDFINKLNLLLLAVLLMLGRGIGSITDKKIFKKNMQL